MAITHILSSRPVSYWVWSAVAALAVAWIAGLYLFHGNREAAIEKATAAGQRITIDLTTGEIAGNFHKLEKKPADSKPEKPPVEMPEAQAPSPVPASAPPETTPVAAEPVGQASEIPEDSPAPAISAGNATDIPVLEKTPSGLLPVTAADGTTPWQYFAQPGMEVPAGVPTVSVIISGLGLSAGVTRDALDLPPSITLSFSPYASAASAAAEKAREKGHEILIDLPLESLDFPTSDPGPNGLLSSLSEKENTERLYQTLSRFSGYVGVYAGGLSRLAISPETFGFPLQDLTRRGLLFVHAAPEAQALEAYLSAQATPFLTAQVIADIPPSAEALEAALAKAESEARARGHALVVGHAYPLTIRRIASWAASLKEKGYAIIPVTQLLRMQMAEAAAAQKPAPAAAQ